MIQRIRVYGDPILEQVCAEVADPTSAEIKRVIVDLLDTCRATDSLGLSAPQIGVLKRIAVVRDPRWEDTFIVLVNPRIILQSGRSTIQEGCLSIPGHVDKSTRPDVVNVLYENHFGEEQTIKGTGVLAAALLHEIDHLDGRLFIHYFGSAYCAAVKDWLGRQDIVQSSLPEASFVQAEPPVEMTEDQLPGIGLDDDETGAMADQET